MKAGYNVFEAKIIQSVFSKRNYYLINQLIPQLQKILASDWLFSSVFFFNTRAIN